MSQSQNPPHAPVHLSVVIPCYNESGRIERTLREVAEYLAGRDYSSEIVVVDDGSRDGTAALVERMISQLKTPTRVIAYTPNHGKGYAVKTGMLAAVGEYAIYCDADLSTPMEETANLLPILESGQADVVVGSRNLPDSRVKRPLIRDVLSRGFNLFARLAGVRGLRDTQCPFKCFRREVVQTVFPLQRLERWAFDVEILWLCQQRGYRVVERPVTWVHATGSKMRILRDICRMLGELRQMRRNIARGLYR